MAARIAMIAITTSSSIKVNFLFMVNSLYIKGFDCLFDLADGNIIVPCFTCGVPDPQPDNALSFGSDVIGCDKLKAPSVPVGVSGNPDSGTGKLPFPQRKVCPCPGLTDHPFRSHEVRKTVAGFRFHAFEFLPGRDTLTEGVGQVK